MSRINFFQNAINSCGLSDLGFSGPKFTWWNKRPDGSMVFERLDRFLGNSEWLNLYPDNTVHHLPRFKSDHNPILFASHPSNNVFVPRPFRCEKIWLHQPDFADIVTQSWSPDGDTSSSLNLLQIRALEWNKSVFGNIFHKKNILLKRIEGIHAALANGPNSFLLNLEIELYKSLASQLRLIEEFWASKSRLDWLTLGDQNTTFFHTSVINRRRSNRISAIKNSVGEWIVDHSEIKNHIVNHFQDIFSAAQISPFPSSLCFPNLFNDLPSFPFIPNEMEIKEALFSLNPSKAPGKDGFQPGFFHKFWPTVKSTIIKDVQLAFHTKKVPPLWNDSLICLIPKCNQPQEMKNFRPISLCSSMYKIISKILVQRLKNLLPDLISFNQGAFVQGRKAIDNVVIAQELIASFKRKKKSKRGWMMIKIDLEKAYDKLNWDFIRSTLQAFNFPRDWIDLMMDCISSVSHTIIFNGGLTQPFSPHCGIRQGDPISPFIFILCMEILSKIIQREVDSLNWHPAKIKDIKISHCLFADDNLLFARTDDKSIPSINNSLSMFLAASGLKVNQAKSHIWFSPQTPQHIREHVQNSTGFISKRDPGSYLGFPLGISRKKHEYFFILEKIRNHIAAWKSKLLSPPAKVTLLKAVGMAHLITICNALFFLRAFVTVLIGCSGNFSGVVIGNPRRSFSLVGTESVRTRPKVGWDFINVTQETYLSVLNWLGEC